MRNIAVEAMSRANSSQDQKRCRPGMKTFSHIRAPSFPAYGVKAVTGQNSLHPFKVDAAGEFDLKPWGFAFSVH